MNDRLTYEELIAAKLEQLPAMPAMADAIWARISGELDREMPADEGGDTGNGPSGGGFGFNTWLWPGAGLLLLALAGLIFYSQQDYAPAALMPARKTETPLRQAPPAISLPGDGSPQDYRKNRSNSVPGRSSGDTTQVAPQEAGWLPPPLLRIDSGMANTVPDMPPDSGNHQPSPAAGSGVQIEKSTIQQDTPVVKRPKGVPGISNSDYRIVPGKKDSTRKN